MSADVTMVILRTPALGEGDMEYRVAGVQAAQNLMDPRISQEDKDRQVAVAFAGSVVHREPSAAQAAALQLADEIRQEIGFLETRDPIQVNWTELFPSS